MEGHNRCHNCGRSLTENELYCYFCETDSHENGKKHKKSAEKSIKNFFGIKFGFGKRQK